MFTRRFSVCLATAVLLAALGCAAPTATPDPGATDPSATAYPNPYPATPFSAGILGPVPALTQAQGPATHLGTLTVSPRPATSMQDSRLSLTVRDAQGQPVTGATVRFDLTMPGCSTMPANQPTATEAAEGVYEALTVFTMAGRWRIEAQVSGTGGDGRFEFFLDVR